MNGNKFKLAAGAVVGLLIVVTGGIYLGNNQSGGVGSPPMAIAAPTATAAPTAMPSATRALLPPSSLVEPGTYRMASNGLVASVVPATVSITVPSGWESNKSFVIHKNYSDAGPAFGVWQISNRFKQPCTDHTLFEPTPGPGIDELLNTLATPAGDRSGPAHRRDGRWIQRQIRRADRRDGHLYLPRLQRGKRRGWLLALGLARRQ